MKRALDAGASLRAARVPPTPQAMDDAVEFASLIGSRLCHDLLSPVGSFGNGLELLADEQDPTMRARFVELLDSSARAAIGRLKFSRLAYGSSSGYGEGIAREDLTDALRGLVAEGRDVTLRWVGDATSVPKPAARVLLLLGQVVVESLIRGGSVDLAAEPHGQGWELAVRGTGERVVIDPTLIAALEAETAPTPKTVGVALARRIAAACDGTMMVARPEGGELLVGASLARVAAAP